MLLMSIIDVGEDKDEVEDDEVEEMSIIKEEVLMTRLAVLKNVVMLLFSKKMF